MTSAPMRKLHDLLNVGPSAQKDSAKLQTLGNNSFQNVPIDPYQLQNNQGDLAGGNFPFRNFPRNQNLYYNPLIRTNDNSYPSPMIHFNGLQNQRLPAQVFLSEPSQVDIENQANIYGSSINSQLLNSLTVLEGSKLSMLNQHKNLGELLHKSYLSTHSTTGLQSPFVSANQSQYIGYNQNSINPDYSNFLPKSVLGTPLQPPQVMRSQNIPHQTAETSNEGLIQQLEALLKQSNGRDIKMALAGLIQQYGNKNPQNRALELLARMQEEASQRQGNQKTISLSNGYVMNTVNRSAAESNMRHFVDPTRIMNNKMMGSNGAMFTDASSKKKHYSTIVEEDSFMLGDGSFNQATKHSPAQTLNQKLGAMNINMDTFAETQKEHTEYMGRLPVDAELSAIFNERINPDLEPPGTLNREERTGKILKYKNKIRKYRREHPVNRNFKGRSVVAGKKPRIKGKFVTIEEYVEYIKTTGPDEADLQLNERLNESTAYDGSERSTREHDLNIKEENL